MPLYTQVFILFLSKSSRFVIPRCVLGNHIYKPIHISSWPVNVLMENLIFFECLFSPISYAINAKMKEEYHLVSFLNVVESRCTISFGGIRKLRHTLRWAEWVDEV